MFADLECFAQPLRKRGKRFVAFQAGGGGLVQKPPVVCQQARCRWADGQLVVQFSTAGAFIEATPSALGLPSHWRGFSRLRLAATGAVELVVLGPRCRLGTRRRRLDLTDLPLTAGILPVWEPTGIRLVARGRGTVRVRALELMPGETPLPVVDRFGQRVHANWPGKIRRVADLRPEKLEIGRRNLDPFGGWTAGPRFAATGFFRVAQERGRWWLVTPAGHPFWSIGVTGVRTIEETLVGGRECLFAKPTPNFYLANVRRKYGSLKRWRDHTLARFQSWGLNTIGSFTSQDLVLEQQQIPHTRILRTRGGVPDLRPSFADVFDPNWERWLDELMAREVAPHRANPWLVGWFVDNEARWRDWGAQGERYARKYFSTIARLLKKHAPNHLYLGCRFVRVPPHENIVRIAGQHVDVLSVNCYALWPDRRAFTHWHRMSGGKPVLIGEHHMSLASARQLPPLWRAFSAAERRRYYTKFVREWARLPFSVGCHWFQYTDQPLTGRARDGENQIIGFVDITDQPYPELVAGARGVTARMYAWHNGA